MCVAFIAMFGLCAAGVAMADSDYERLKHYANKIVAKMPSTWRLVEEKTGVIPSGHYDGLKYEGPGGLYLVLAGDLDVTYNWKDKSGMWHKEPILKEAILLWIMPSEYHQSWKRFFIMKSRVPVEQIYSGKKVKVYGEEGHHWPPEASNRFEEIKPHISTYGGTPDHTVLSWTTWQKDIKKVLQGSE